MDNSMKEKIEKLNIISPIKAIISNQVNELGENENVITDEKIRIEKDGKIEEADVILSFVTGTEYKPFIAYTFESTENKDDNYKETIDIGEVVTDENGYYLVVPSKEDHDKVVIPTILAIGNSNLDDPEQIVENVRTEINDPNFDVISLNTIDQYLGEFEEEYNENRQEGIFFKVKESLSVLIPITRLRIIKNNYIKRINKMYQQAIEDKYNFLSKEEVEEKIDENNATYNEVVDLINDFSKYSDKVNVDKDIDKLKEMQDALDSAKVIYDEKAEEIAQDEQLAAESENLDNEITEEVTETYEPKIVETENVEHIEEPTLEENNVLSDSQEVVTNQNNLESSVFEEKEAEPMNEMIDKNVDILELADEVIERKDADKAVESVLGRLKKSTDEMISKFNKEMEDFTEDLIKQLLEKYDRKQNETVKAIIKGYDDAYNKLYQSLTTDLDKYMLLNKTKLGEAQNANSVLNSKLSNKEKELENAYSYNEELRKTVDEKDNTISSLNAEKEKNYTTIDSQKNQISQLEATIEEKDKKISELETDKRQEEANNDKLTIELKAKDAKINELTSNLAKAEETNMDYKSQLETMSKNMNDLRKNYEEYRIEIEKRNNMLEAKVNKFEEFFSNMQNLQNSVSAMAGEYSSEDKEKAK